MFDTLDQFGGIYVAMFAVGVISGVFPPVNSEITLIALALVRPSWPEVIVLAVIAALGQSITHATIFRTARGLTKLGAKKRPWLESKIARAHQILAKWKGGEPLLIACAAILGVPPMVLVACLAGVLRIRFGTFFAISVPLRTARFILIVVIARAF
jgi:membrane protein YqaA with SNARE-associated domain